METWLLPNGEYRLVAKALKSFGDSRNPNDYERWVSPLISIQRPVQFHSQDILSVDMEADSATNLQNSADESNELSAVAQ